MNNNPIGVFDSGIGGLSLIKEIKKLLPCESIIYLADKKHFPYGKKTPEQIKQVAKRNVEWLLSQDAKLIVVACNTATVHAISYLRRVFPAVSFVGMEPAVKPAAKKSKKKILVLSSPKATNSKQLKLLISKFAQKDKVINVGSLELVKAVEKQSSQKKIAELLKQMLPKDILDKTDTIVLGCTHFPLIKSQIQKHVGKKIIIIDSGEAVAKRIKTVLEENHLSSNNKNSSNKYLTTSESKIFRNIQFKSIHPET